MCRTDSSGGPFRSGRLRAPSLVPTSRVSSVPVHQTLVVDAQRRTNGSGEEVKNVRRRETIFGPDVGEDDEPGWTKSDEGAQVDVATVKNWVERAKSEEGLHSTTTLQALVNLKRPTLLLQQLEPAEPAEIQSRRDSIQDPLHILKFNYDATAPLVKITMSIYPTPPPPIPQIEGKEAPSIVEEDPKIIYSGTHEGGFNKIFQLPTSNALDLSSAINTEANSDDASSIDQKMADINLDGPDLAAVPEVPASQFDRDLPTHPERRRFGLFRRAQPEPDVEAAQIELQNRNIEAKAKEQEPKAPEMGMRLLIRLDALGPEGEPLKRRNSQLTHILLTGTSVQDTTGENPNRKRVWVIKVARREVVVSDLHRSNKPMLTLDWRTHLPSQRDLRSFVSVDKHIISTCCRRSICVDTKRVYRLFVISA